MRTEDLDWNKIRALFEQAQQKQGADLAAFLHDACGGDLLLRAEVERLLASDKAAEAERFLENPAVSPHSLPTESLRRTEMELATQADPYQTNRPQSKRRIGAWELGNEIGRGGMGAVYLAERADGAYEQKAAIKLLNPGMGNDIVSRFLQERQILAKLNHPNVARILDGGTVENMPWVAMEYVEGQSLRKFLSSHGPLPLAQVLEITRQICAGLGAAHNHGVIHRDIKPENIMIDEQEGCFSLKILDFGISKILSEDRLGTDTKTGAILGTPAYMSPEQASGRNGESIDVRSDIYSVGLVVYEMLTGKQAFDGKSILEILIQQREKMPVPPRQIRPEIPTRIEEVILKVLAKSPGDRPPTISKFADLFETAYREDAKPAEKSALKSLPVVFPSFLLIGILIAFILKGTTHSPKPDPVTPKLQYAVFRQTTQNPLQLLAGNEVYEGDKIHFEFRLPFPGAVYLLFKMKDGDLVWVNPRKDGLPATGAAGQALRAPEQDGIRMGKEPGLQDYLAIYVPFTNKWSIRNLVPSSELEIKQPAPEINFQRAFISKDAAARIMNDLAGNAFGLSLPLQTQVNPVSLALPADMNEKILFHTITLKQAPKN